MPLEAIDSFIRSLAHRERCEAGAAVLSHGATTQIRYAMPLAWPWPRAFAYRSEFFCAGPGAQSLQEVAQAPESQNEHVVNFFSADLAREAQHFIDAGYVQAWTSELLARPLGAAWHRPLADDARVHEVACTQDMARHASLAGISNPGTSRDPCIHNVFATRGDEVVAKGQLVLLPGLQAYISDMFTASAYRRSGLCHRIMRTLEDKARALGAAQACLAPGHEAASFGLYARYGYAPVATRAVLIRREARA